MKLIITIGTQFDDEYRESSRCTIEVDSDATIGDALVKAKAESAPMVESPTVQKRLEPHMYLMHPHTREKLDVDKKVDEYGLTDGSILRLMSGVR